MNAEPMERTSDHLDEPRPFAHLRDTGLLWLINTTVFHPRGYALAMHFDDHGNATGWTLIGDGNEAWHFVDDGDIDVLMRATKELLR